MNKQVKSWAKCNPAEMAKLMSETTLKYTLLDAKYDILKMAEALRVIAYPAGDEALIGDAADFIRANFSIDDLEEGL